MAGIRKKGDGYHCTFRFQGSATTSPSETSRSPGPGQGHRGGRDAGLIERGRLTHPRRCRLEDFVAAGGKARSFPPGPKTSPLRQLFDHYLATHANGTIEESSLGTARSHLNQFAETIGERFRIQALTLLDLQGHVDRRRKKGVSPVTLKKEVATVRACWNWAVHGGLSRALSRPRAAVPEGGRKRALPHLRRDRGHHRRREPRRGPARRPLGGPVPYTGRRSRSSLHHVRRATARCPGSTRWWRSRPTREHGGARCSGRWPPTWTWPPGSSPSGRRSGSRASIDAHRALTPKLAEVLREWLAVRPEGPFLFCQAEQVTRSKTKREGPTAVTKDEAHDHFKRTAWRARSGGASRLPRPPALFISALASEGVDQRVIDEVVGHQSEEQRKRYRHLYPG